MKFIKRIRNGEYSLQKTFWLYGVLVFFIALIIYSTVFTILKVIFRFDEIAVRYITTFIILLYALYQINFSIGLFKVARNYKGNIIWKYGSLIIAAFILIINIFNIYYSFRFIFIYSDIYKYTNKYFLYPNSLKSKILGLLFLTFIIYFIVSMNKLFKIYFIKSNNTKVTNEKEEEEEEEEEDIVNNTSVVLLESQEVFIPSNVDILNTEQKLSVSKELISDNHNSNKNVNIIDKHKEDYPKTFFKTKFKKYFLIVSGGLFIIFIILFSNNSINNFSFLHKTSDLKKEETKGGVKYGKTLTRQEAITIFGGPESYFAPTMPCVEFKKNLPLGFRKIKWGDTFKQHETTLYNVSGGYEETFRRMDHDQDKPNAGWKWQYDIYIDKNEKYKIGPVKINHVYYSFTPDTGLVQVDILYHGGNNINLMHNMLEERWGKCFSADPNQEKDKHIAQWYNEDVIATVYKTGKDSEWLSIVSTKLTRQFVAIWTKSETIKDKKIEHEIKKGASEDF